MTIQAEFTPWQICHLVGEEQRRLVMEAWKS